MKTITWSERRVEFNIPRDTYTSFRGQVTWLHGNDKLNLEHPRKT